jgi:DNA-binding FadR family transcriptional regulator
MIGTLTEIIWETGRINLAGFSLRESAETHRRIYDTVRARSPESARREMATHLEHAMWEQIKHEGGDGADR